MEQNIQLYGRNDMVMLQNEKIYGSLGLAEKYIVKTKQGTPPLLLDSSLKSKFLGMNIYGKSTQMSTQGNQLFDCNNYSDTDVTGNGDIRPSAIIPVEAGKYTISRGNTSDINIYFRKNINGDYGVGTQIYQNTTHLINLESDGNIIVYTNKDGKLSLAIDIMVNKGTIALPYEPYTGGIPSPNPEYPQEIVSVGDSGSIDVKATGKNLWNKEYAIDKNNWQKSVIQDYSDMIYIPIFVGKGNVVTISYANIEDGLGFYTYVCWNGININNGVIYNNEVYRNPATEIVDTDYIYIMTYPDSFDNFIKYMNGILQIEISSVATEYQPHTEQSFTVLTPNGLPGIPASFGGNYTDADGQQWICDEVDFERGKIIRNIVIRTFSGNEHIGSNGGIVNGIFRCTVNFPEVPNKAAIDGLCDKFKKGAGDMERFNIGYRMLYLWIDISRLNGESSTLDDVKDFLNNNPITVCTKREIPIETPLSTEEISAYKALHSNYPTTIVDNSEQAEMSVVYKSFENV